MKNYDLYFRVILLPVFFFTCDVQKNADTPRDYNDTVNRQFWSADWSPDGRFIAVAGVDSILRIYHAEDLELHLSFFLDSWIHVVKWSPDGKQMAIATLDKYVNLLIIEDEEIIRLDHPGGSRATGWNHDGTLLAVGDLEGNIQIWDYLGRLINKVENYYDPDFVGRSFLSLDWHPIRNEFIVTNSRINLCDSAGAVLQIIEHQNKEAIILSTRWHPSGSFFVLGDYGYNREGENVPSLLHFWSDDGILMHGIHGSKGEYRNISWNQVGTRLATASDVLRIWDADGSLLYESPPDGSNYLWGVSWNHDGTKVVTASRHKTIAIWDQKARIIRRVDVP